MSEGQQEDFDMEDALTTEEELLLKHETMRDFFLQQLKALRDSMVSFQTKMQEDLKACMEATEQNFTEELKSNTERTHGLVRTDLQLLDEKIQKAENRFDAKIRAMEESMSHRMNLMGNKLEGMSSRLVKMDMEICSALASTSVEPTSSLLGDMLSADTTEQSDQPSAKSAALVTTSESDLAQVPEVIFVSQCEPSQSPIGHHQGATSMIPMRTGASLPQRSLIPYLQPVAKSAAVTSTLVSDEMDDETFIDLLTRPTQFPSHQPQGMTSNPSRSEASLHDRPVDLDDGDDSGSIHSIQSWPLPDASGLLHILKC